MHIIGKTEAATPYEESLVVGTSVDDLDRKLAVSIAKYGVVIDRPGTLPPLLRAAATDAQCETTDSATPLDMSKGATGWLYKIVRTGPQSYYKQFVNYIRPVMYAAI